MRIIFLSDLWTILLCFIVWLVVQVGVAQICLHLPDRFFLPDSFFFKAQPFEKEGLIYDSIFQVRRWKHLLPDGGALWKKRGYKKKRLESFSEGNLSRFLIESARGETVHWLSILPFWLFGFFTPPLVPWIMLLYALLFNLPPIITQRYNRPRVQRLLERKKQITTPTGI